MTKNEKQLIARIITIRDSKKIIDDPESLYTIKKLSTNNYFCEVIIGDHVFAARGKDTKDVIKKVLKEMQ